MTKKCIAKETARKGKITTHVSFTAAIMPDQHNFSFANVDMRAILDGATILEWETAVDNAKIINFLRKHLNNREWC